MFWLRVLWNLLGVVGLGAVLLIGLLVWTFWPVPEFEFDWRSHAAAAYDAGDCDLAFSLMIQGRSLDGETALARAEELLADDNCTFISRSALEESLVFEREMLEWDANFAEEFPETANQEDSWLQQYVSRFGTSLRFTSYAGPEGSDMPPLFWGRYLVREIRCNLTYTDATITWSYVTQLAGLLDDESILDSTWRRRERACARSALDLAEIAIKRTVQGEDTQTRIANGTIAANLITDGGWGDAGSIARAHVLRARSSLELGSHLGANECQLALPNIEFVSAGAALENLVAAAFLGQPDEALDLLIAELQSDRFESVEAKQIEFWTYAQAQLTNANVGGLALDPETQSDYDRWITAAQAGDYSFLGPNLPATMVLEDDHCFDYWTEPVLIEDDKAKGDLQDGAGLPLDAASGATTPTEVENPDTDD